MQEQLSSLFPLEELTQNISVISSIKVSCENTASRLFDLINSHCCRGTVPGFGCRGFLFLLTIICLRIKHIEY